MDCCLIPPFPDILSCYLIVLALLKNTFSVFCLRRRLFPFNEIIFYVYRSIVVRFGFQWYPLLKWGGGKTNHLSDLHCSLILFDWKKGRWNFLDHSRFSFLQFPSDLALQGSWFEATRLHGIKFIQVIVPDWSSAIGRTAHPLYGWFLAFSV